MRYIQFPNTTVNIQPNTVYVTTIYQNNSMSYILVMGLARILNFQNGALTSNYYSEHQYNIYDQNNNFIDTLDSEVCAVSTYQGSMPIWNGTTVEQESALLPYSVYQYVPRRFPSFIPPLSRLTININMTNSATETYGGWGFALTDEEMLQVLTGKLIKQLE
ncbi:MAG: hypothetical protein QXU98_09405 [Candidatus Parvarchaeota archaeon]